MVKMDRLPDSRPEEDLSPWEALMRAARVGDEGMARRALAAGADPARRDDSGEDAIRVAIAEAAFRGRWEGLEARHHKVVEMLAPLADGAALDDWGLTVLARAARSGDVECVRAALPWADLDARVDGGCSLREFAEREGTPEIADLVDAERARREAAEIGRAAKPARGSKGPRAL